MLDCGGNLVEGAAACAVGGGRSAVSGGVRDGFQVAMLFRKDWDICKCAVSMELDPRAGKLLGEN